MSQVFINEKFNNRMYQYDMQSRMYRDGIIYLNGPISSQTAYEVTSQLQYLEAVDPKQTIKLIINSPGGEINSGLAIIDVMNSIKNDVETVCLGMAASMASLILAAGTKGKRKIYTHSKVLIHQPLINGGLGGQASDIEIHAKDLIETKKTVNELLAKWTGKTVKQIEHDTDRDNYLNAQEAIDYGLVDSIQK